MAIALIAGGVYWFGFRGDDKDDKADTTSSPSASQSPTDEASDPGADMDRDDEPTDDPTTAIPTPTPTSSLTPYVVLSPGTCFDHPQLSSAVTDVEKRSCNGPHNGEVISNRTLTGSFAGEFSIRSKAMSLCKADAESRMRRMSSRPAPYYFVIYPSYTTYQLKNKKTISCSLTASSTKDGTKLRAPLPN
ncbi:hypothetical protein [Streptomyces sp. NPDC005438]|uniref:hypothetical protein n=1 Tax=Streptomyces sp. NPDC005438 TaxID=3156880 RepID=UPI0033B9FD16